MAAERAEFLAAQGKNVTIVETIFTRTLIKEGTAKEVRGIDAETETQRDIQADSVVVAVGAKPVEFPLEGLEKAGIKACVIGDAQEIYGIAEAVRSRFVAGSSI